MTKWGVVGYSEALRQEGAHIGVRVTCVEPGYVDTELQGHNTNPMVVERIEQGKARTPARCSRPPTSPTRSCYAVSQPEHAAVNEILVRPSAEKR